MPLLDHFRPPLSEWCPWESFHSGWATRIADALNNRLPPQFVATEHRHAGSFLEIDVATFEHSPATQPPAPPNGPAVATLPALWAPPAPAQTMPAIFPDAFEVRVFSTRAGMTLVAAIELVSPGNKDRPEERTAFAAKCASYLHRGVSLIVVDIVTDRHFNLHNELMHLLDADPRFQLPAEAHLYAVAYRPVRREERPEFDLWPTTLQVGAALPLLPLRLTGDLFVPVDFEATYQEACRRRRLV
jgi:hypothetical protein